MRITPETSCRAACVVERPEEIIDPEFDDTRLDVYLGWLRHFIGNAANNEPLNDTNLDIANQEATLRDQAKACIQRIQDGDCPIFFINSGQYPRYEHGLFSYSFAETVVDHPFQS